MKGQTYTVRYDLSAVGNAHEVIQAKEAKGYEVVALAATGNFLYVSYRSVS